MSLRDVLPKSFAILEELQKANMMDGADWVPVDNAVRKAICEAFPRRLGQVEKRNGKPISSAAIYNDKWRDRNPHKRSAHLAVQDAKRYGKMTHLSCSACGATEQVEVHHPDYGRPLDVDWLCRGCHAALHRKLAG